MGISPFPQMFPFQYMLVSNWKQIQPPLPKGERAARMRGEGIMVGGGMTCLPLGKGGFFLNLI